MPTKEMVWSRSEVDEFDCWVWTAYRDKRNGYGRIDHLWAHRVSHELFIGPVPAGYTVDHLCRNRACVNPEHLEAVTRTINFLRGMHPSAATASTDVCKRGHEMTEENTYYRPDDSGWRMCRACIQIRSRRQDVKRAQARATEDVVA